MALILLPSPVVFDDSSLLPPYRSESEHLTAERVPQAVALCMALIGGAGAIEYAYHPERLGAFLVVYGLEALVFAPLLFARRALLQRGRLWRVNVVTWAVIAVLMHAYGAAAGVAPEMMALAVICLMTGASLLLPWGARGQAVLVGACALAFGALLWLGAAPAVPAPHLLFAIGAAAAISIVGAHHLELHRFAIFCEATRREEEASVSGSLVAIAKEINASLDAEDVLDRIAGVIRSALHGSWSVIVLREHPRDVFLVVGRAGRVPGAIATLRGVEFGPGAFPLVDRVLAERDVAVTDQDADAATAGLMLRWQTRSLLATALTQRDQVVGVLITGTHARSERFSDRGRDLFRGIAQHVAIALTNVRLVTDLRRANELKSEFLSTMSHELRTPLNVIIGYADLLREEAFGPVPDDQQDVLGRLRTNAHSLLELINATLEVNRIEAGRTGVHLREVDLRQLLTELQFETDQLPRPSGVALRWEVPRGTDVIRTDAVKLKIVVRNLVGNALKFTKRGAVAVQVTHDSRGRQLEVQVKDTGPGIPAEDLPHIFDMFHQAPSAANTGGVGLGLYIVKRFVDLLGGRVSATSRVGEGSVFRVAIPAGIAAQPASLDAHRLRRSA